MILRQTVPVPVPVPVPVLSFHRLLFLKGRVYVLIYKGFDTPWWFVLSMSNVLIMDIAIRHSSLTAVVQPVELQQVAVTELHPLADDISECWDLGYDGGSGAILEGRLAVVHH